MTERRQRLRRAARQRRLALGVRHRLRRTRWPGSTPTLPDGVDPATLAAYCLMLGDDALVLSHRLSRVVQPARPDLEEDIALANIALDLLGQARLLLARAAAADADVVPVLPEGRRCRRRTRSRSSATAHEFRNVGLVEVDNGDFAADRGPAPAVLRPAGWPLFERLTVQPRPGARRGRGQGRQGADLPPRLRRRGGSSPWLAAPRSPGAGCWPALDLLWPCVRRAVRSRTDVEQPMAAAGVGVDPATVRSGGRRGARPGPRGRAASTARRSRRRPAATAAPDATGCTPRRWAGCSPRCRCVARAHPRGRW